MKRDIRICVVIGVIAGLALGCSSVSGPETTPRPVLDPAPQSEDGAGESAASGATEPQATESPSEKEVDLTNTIRWRTASEVENFGYDVFRSESPEGPFDKLTEEPIEGAGTTDEVQSYAFVDDTIDPHKDYYYYVESISMSGVREKFTPVGKAKAKIPPEGP